MNFKEILLAVVSLQLVTASPDSFFTITELQTSRHFGSNDQSRLSSLVSAPAATPPKPSSSPLNAFSTKLFRLLGPSNTHRNLVYSPLSIHTLLSFIFMGALNKTADELQTALEISPLPAEVARMFQSLLQHIKQQSTRDHQLILASKMYYNDGLQFKQDFHKRARIYFDTEVQPTAFRDSLGATTQINQWVAEKTNQRIQNLIAPGIVDASTQVILVNAIYLKAKWEKEFSAYDTEKAHFYITKSQIAPVEMMYIDDTFKSSSLPSLNAWAIELPFKDSDISMLLILPNEVDGLSRLEQTLSYTDLGSLSKTLKRDITTLYLPKFRIEFELDLVEPLKRLGILRAFTENADLQCFFQNQTVKISQVQHKAYINLNEGGVEAAAASFGKLTPLSLPYNTNIVKFDHPFMFAILSPESVYFIGHVVRP